MGGRAGAGAVAAAVGTSPVVVGFVQGQDRPQVPLAEDKHPVGDLAPGGEHESLRKSVRAGFGAGSSLPECRRRRGPLRTNR
jgi:hypothetical protein